METSRRHANADPMEYVQMLPRRPAVPLTIRFTVRDVTVVAQRLATTLTASVCVLMVCVFCDALATCSGCIPTPP